MNIKIHFLLFEIHFLDLIHFGFHLVREVVHYFDLSRNLRHFQVPQIGFRFDFHHFLNHDLPYRLLHHHLHHHLLNHLHFQVLLLHFVALLLHLSLVDFLHYLKVAHFHCFHYLYHLDHLHPFYL